VSVCVSLSVCVCVSLSVCVCVYLSVCVSVCLSLSLSLSLSDGVSARQVAQSQEKMSRLEQEKEHWLLEAQLGQVRLQKEVQRIAQLETQITTGRPSETHSAADDPDPVCADAPEPVQDTSVVRDCSPVF